MTREKIRCAYCKNGMCTLVLYKHMCDSGSEPSECRIYQGYIARREDKIRLRMEEKHRRAMESECPKVTPEESKRIARWASRFLEAATRDNDF